MGIFSENPKSFKMDRKSPLASRLKSSISKKLLQFLGNYTDDVLAEYIIVLVCNGKHQIQARDDLEAFLGESSGEFVSWLWDHLLKYAHQSNSAIGVLDPKDVTGNSLSSGGVDRDLRSNRPKEVQNHHIGNAESLLTRNGKHCRPSAHASSHVASRYMELSVGVQYRKGPISPLNEANANKIQSQGQRSTNLKGIGATENIHEFHDDCLTQKPSRNGDSSLIPAGRDQCYECMDKSKKIVNHNGNGLASQLLDFPKKEMALRDLQPSVIEGSSTTQIHAANLAVRSPPRAVEEISYRSKKSRGSVWDRLGKPREENCFVNDKTVDANAVDIVEKVQEVYQQHTLPMPFHNEELCERMKNEVHDFDKSSNGDIPGECRKLEQGVSMKCKINAANNIWRKRHFGEISSGPSSCLVSLVGQVNTDHQNEEKSQDLNRLNSTSQSATPALVSQVQVVKQRLQQIQMEMSKLRTKQLVMKKDGQPHVLSTSGVNKHSEDDVESRTVFVTNVHFAATKEALSLYFAKCGVVLSVVILSDKLNGQPKGSAYITFANKESVDKALALSGSSFFSRTLKVIRKAEEATVTSTPPQHAGKLARAQLFPSSRKTALDKSLYSSSHLQWRREPVSAPSEPTASINQDKGVGSAASHQLLSSSLASIGTTKTAAST